MYQYKKICSVLILAAGLLSCRKYVEDVPVQGQRVLVYTDDYRALMNNYSGSSGTETAYGVAPALSCDDADFTATEIQTSLSTNIINTAMYTWNKPFYVDQQSDYDWGFIYGAMYSCNTVINGVMGSVGGDIVAKSTILGEALMQRAFAYFMLVNTYAKQYDAATADTDPGVPVLLNPALFVDLTRTPVKQVYEQMISDIRRAIPLLPVLQPINFRPNKASAYALLSKAYLNMRNFTSAAEFADSTLALSSELYDYNTAVSGTTYTFLSQFNDKQVLLRKVARATYGSYQLSQPLLTLLGTKDLRYTLFVRDGSNFSPAFTGSGFWPRDKYTGYPDKPAVGLTVNETWLIKAECLARAGKKDDAVKMLNDLRKKRFKPADYADLSAASNDEALQLVVDERRREFFGSGLRWLDQRRLNKDPQFAKTVTRVFNNVTYTLEPNSNGYVFPLANFMVTQNPEMVQNPK